MNFGTKQLNDNNESARGRGASNGKYINRVKNMYIGNKMQSSAPVYITAVFYAAARLFDESKIGRYLLFWPKSPLKR